MGQTSSSAPSAEPNSHQQTGLTKKSTSFLKQTERETTEKEDSKYEVLETAHVVRGCHHGLAPEIHFLPERPSGVIVGEDALSCSQLPQ